MRVTQLIVAAFVTLSVSATPVANTDQAEIDVRAVNDIQAEPLVAREEAEAARRRCPKKYHRHQGKCCRRRKLRRTYYDCHPW
ncbi:hypothetical protein CP533_5214 [Ophiocordyceps camponoti-saundersi (nom. inval.)]|nr:hypothetical protein CP533_5214 [Ophiocordyceps camponoti-saundersi (nom. inval.)]